MGVSLFFLWFSSIAFASSGITYHGRILRPNGTVVNSATTQFRIQIRSPGAENCLLWEESQTKDLTNTNGVFTITIADTSEPSLIPNALPFSLERVFSNRSSFTGLTGCNAGSIYNPNSLDGRSLLVSFRELPTDPWEQMPVTKVNYTPIALNAVQFEGYKATEFLKIDPLSTQTPLTPGQVTTLLDLVTGNYLKPSDSTTGDLTGTYGATIVAGIRGRALPTVAPTINQILKFDGTNWVYASDDAGTAPSDASYTAKGVVQFDTDAATSGINVTSGVASLANVIAAAGPIGNAQTIPVITYDAKGRLTAVTPATVDDTTKLSLDGSDTMSGSLNMGNQSITNASSVSANNFSGRNLILNDNDSNTATLRTPTDLVANYSLQLPADDGTASGQVLTTDGAGILSWSTPASGISVTANQAVIANGTGTGLVNFTCLPNQAFSFDGAGLPICQSVTPAGGFINSGNSYGANATLGTNDNFDLNFETNSTTKMTLQAGGNVGIGTTTPATRLDVVGELKVGNSGTSCSSNTEGAFRWNSVTKTPEVCDGTSWRPIPITSTAGCTGPNAFSFTNVTNASLSTVITSNAVTPTGCAATLSISVSGSGTPEISVNNGPWTTSTTIDSGQSFRIKLTSSGSANTAHNAVVVIGSTTGSAWSVTTRASNTRIFRTNLSYNGNLGGVTGADSICQSAAAAASYGGFWRAIISDSTWSASDRLIVSYPVVRATDGVTTVAASNLWGGGLNNSVSTTGEYNWTGSDSMGVRSSGLHCNDWTTGSISYYGRWGFSLNADGQWISHSNTTCNASHRIYCLEQPDPGCSPDVFSFTDVSNATTNTLYTSDVIVPTGCAASSTVLISGPGNPEFRINGGVWMKSGVMSPGDSIQIRQTTLANYGYANRARILIGNRDITWTVTSIAGGTKMFLTGNTYNGNMGGLAGADANCQNAAIAAGYPGSWKAVLSSSTVNARDRVTITYPVVRVTDGRLIAPTNLWTGSILNPLSDAAGYPHAWTGSSSDGNKSTLFCNDWTDGSSGQSGIRGLANSPSSAWFENGTKLCNETASLYCVEQ